MVAEEPAVVRYSHTAEGRSVQPLPRRLTGEYRGEYLPSGPRYDFPRIRVLRGVPAGLGEPVFDKLDASLAAAVLSIPATKGFEIGSGFAGTRMKGSEHNDAFLPSEEGRLRTATNNSGGIQGGISNGEPIVIRVAFKPTATIRKEQQTINDKGQATTLAAKGRHDPCVLPRAVPMVEAMVNLVLADHLLRQQGQCSLW